MNPSPDHDSQRLMNDLLGSYHRELTKSAWFALIRWSIPSSLVVGMPFANTALWILYRQRIWRLIARCAVRQSMRMT